MNLLQSSVLTTLAVCACIGFASQAKADIQTIRNSDSAIWASVGGTEFAYKESATPPNLPDSERDWIASGAAGLTAMGPTNLYAALEGSYAFGNAHYIGAYFYFPTTPLQGTTSEHIATVDGRLGKGYALYNSMMLIPYTELGYRYWGRHLTAGQTENYDNFDLLGGLMLQVSPSSSLVFSVYGSAGVTFDPVMKTGGFAYDLGDSAMYKVGGKIGYDLTRHIELFTSLDYDHFRYGQSPVVNAAYEPNSNTNEAAARIGLAYHFR